VPAQRSGLEDFAIRLSESGLSEYFEFDSIAPKLHECGDPKERPELLDRQPKSAVVAATAKFVVADAVDVAATAVGGGGAVTGKLVGVVAAAPADSSQSLDSAPEEYSQSRNPGPKSERDLDLDPEVVVGTKVRMHLHLLFQLQLRSMRSLEGYLVCQ
jgi:hypothetical protein